jgi:hypothetical protein
MCILNDDRTAPGLVQERPTSSPTPPTPVRILQSAKQVKRQADDLTEIVAYIIGVVRNNRFHYHEG